MVHPERIILDIGDGVQILKKELSCPSLPHIDVDVLLEKTVDAVQHKGEAFGELVNLTVRMLCGDGHMEQQSTENWNGCGELDVYHDEALEDVSENLLGLEVVTQAAAKFGRELFQTLKQVKLFEEDYLKYEYAGMLNDQSLVLRRR